MKNAAKRGTKLIVIDPRANGLSAHAHLRVQHNPGSDVALLNAVLHTVITEKWVDEDFIKQRTTGF